MNSPAVGGQARLALLYAILDLYRRCAADNWDNFGAKAVGLESAVEAMRLVMAMDADCLLPIPSANPDGYMGLEWQGHGNVASVVDFPPGEIASFVRRGRNYKYYRDDSLASFLASDAMEFIGRMSPEGWRPEAAGEENGTEGIGQGVDAATTDSGDCAEDGFFRLSSPMRLLWD